MPNRLLKLALVIAISSACTAPTPLTTIVPLPTATVDDLSLRTTTPSAAEPVPTPPPTTSNVGATQINATQIPTTPVQSPTLTPANDAENLRLLFVKNDVLWLWQDGAAQPLTHSKSVHWYLPSHDGQIISFVAGDGVKEEIWAVNVDGSNERRLMSVEDFNAIYEELYGRQLEDPQVGVAPVQIGWLPGTHTLFFGTQIVSPGPGSQLHDDLRLVNADTLTETVLFPRREGGRFYFAPDGSKLAIVQPTRLRLFNGNFDLIRDDALVYPESNDGCEINPVYPQIFWSPDSEYLLAFVPSGPESTCGQRRSQTTVWQVPADGSEAKQLADFAFDAARFGQYLPSPDRTRLAYIADRKFHVAQIDGRDDRAIFDFQIATDKLRMERWLDESQVAFWFSDPAQRLVLDTDAGQLTAINDRLAEAWAWRGSNEFIYVTKTENRWEFRLGKLDLSSQPIFSLLIENSEEHIRDLYVIR